MKTEKYDIFEKLLKDQRNYLEGVLGQEERELPASSDEPADDIDLANAFLLNQMHLDLHERKFHALECVRSALRRIEIGTYGECQGCGDEIENGRLRAVPTSALCVTCKSIFELNGISNERAVG